MILLRISAMKGTKTMADYFFENIEAFDSPEAVFGGSKNDKTDLTLCGHNVIYNMYDALCKEFPLHVTKTLLGQAFGNDINSYTFKNHSLENYSEFQYKPYKIVIITSIHGYEQGSAFTAAQFFDMLMHSEDKSLEYLKRNVQFEVVPVLNPWGFDHNDRKNGNSVDLNRNFEKGFSGEKDRESEIYPGAKPLSEVETRLIDGFLEKHRDAKVVLDYHNIYGGYPLFYVYGEKDVQLANGVFSLLTDHWNKKYSVFPKDRLLGLVRPNGNMGMLADHIIEKGMWVLTMETPWCMPCVGEIQYDKPTVSCALEVLVNTILLIVHRER